MNRRDVLKAAIAAATVTPKSVFGGVIIVDGENPETGSHVYHIDPTNGDDANDGQPAPFGNGPWQSISKLSGTFSPGDIIYLRAGTHSVGATFLDPTSSGSLGNPIKVQGYPGEAATLDTIGGSFDGDGVGPIRLTNVDYWWFDDLICTTDYQSFAAMNGDFHKFTRLTQQEGSSSGSDNAGFIKINRAVADGWEIDNCDLAGHVSTNNNSATLYLYETENVAVKRSNLRIRGASGGPIIHFKQGNTSLASVASEELLFEGLLIDFTNGNTSRQAIHLAAAGALFRNCIIIGRRCLDNTNGASGGVGQMYANSFQHCTFYWTAGGDDHVIVRREGSHANSGVGNIFEDCLFVNCQLSIHRYTGAYAHNTVTDYNCYRAGSSAISEHGTDYDLAGWVTQNSQDANSVQGTPTFVTTPDVTDPTTFRLAPASVGYQAASDGKDMGADVDLVGTY